MRQGLFVVQSGPADPARVDEYNNWYDIVHIPAIRAVPGVAGARRYRVCDPATGDPVAAEPSFLAIYELEADDLSRPLRDMAAATSGDGAPPPGLLRTDPPATVTLYESLD